MLYESLETQKLNNLTASATLLPKLLIYYANFANHYVKSKFQFLSMFLVISGSLNELKNLFSRHPNIPEVPRNDPWQNLETSFFDQKFSKKWPFKSIKDPALQHLESIVFEQTQCDPELKQLVWAWKKYPSSNERLDFSELTFWGGQLTKMSQFFKVKTRPALTPYYSYRAQEICSTSHWKHKNWRI